MHAILFLLLTLRLDSLLGSSVLLEVISGDHEDTCGLFPPCRQLGEGTWEILEDCRYYVSCSLQGDGSFLQHNLQCPGAGTSCTPRSTASVSTTTWQPSAECSKE